MLVHVKHWVHQPIVKEFISTKTLLHISLNQAIQSFIGIITDPIYIIMCWTDPFVVVEKVSPVDYLMQFSPDGKKKTIHCDELLFDPCDQGRHNWIKFKLTC